MTTTTTTTTTTTHDRLAALLRAAGPAHHQAFLATDGVDAEWPLWYAGHLKEDVGALLGPELTTSELVYLLVAADKEHRRRAPRSDWASFYATFILERHG